MSPREVATMICDGIIPNLRDYAQYKHGSWKEKESLIRSFLVQNEYDSFKVSYLGPKGLEENIENLCAVEKEEHSDSFGIWTVEDSEFVKILKERFPASNQQWTWIARAVGHEMSPKLGDLVESISPDLGDLNQYNSGEELVDVINTKTPKNLTGSEFKYLQSLIQRACTKDAFQTQSLETGSFLFYVFAEQGSPHVVTMNTYAILCPFRKYRTRCD